jgi:anti-anti-sigma factor
MTKETSLIPFKAKGNITAANIESFRSRLHNELDIFPGSMFLMDMSEVILLDSAGLMAIVGAFQIAQQRGKRFVICAAADPVRIIFELVKLDEIIEIYPDYDNFLLAAA